MLDSGTGGPWTPPPAGGTGRSGRRKGLIAGGALVGLGAVAGAGFLAYNLYFASGPQPAEALPDSTVGYLSVDIDPSGKQKLEALDTLSKFPAFAEESGIKSQDDLRAKLFESVQGDGVCEGLDFDDDVAPWLGNRVAVAAVDLGTSDDDSDELPVTPVVVLEIKDAGKAETGLQALRDCAAESGLDDAVSPEAGNEGDEASEIGWSIVGDWVVVAQTEELATEVTDAAADAPLSDDDSYNKWIDAAGDDGILTGYISPDAAPLLSTVFAEAGSFSAGVTCDGFSGSESDFGTDTGTDFDSETGDEFSLDEDCSDDSEAADPEIQDQLDDALKDFEGGAVKVRFDDGALEVEAAGSATMSAIASLTGSDRGGDVVATLPADTAAAIGFGFDPGWVDDLTAYVSDSLAGSGLGDVDDLFDEAEEATGLSLPEDIETLFGESASISLGSDFDADEVESGGPGDLPVGIKVQGDADAIKAVLDKILGGEDVPDELSEFVDYDSEGDYVAGGPSSDYRDQLLEDGGLGDDDTYQDVVPESDDASQVFYVNFDADDWLVDLVKTFGSDDEVDEVVENVEPLSALGFSTWIDDGDVAHSLLKITTD